MTALTEGLPAGSTVERRDPRRRPGARREGWIRRAPLMPALAFTIIVTQVPFLLTLYYSLKSWNLLRPGSEHFVGLSNYVDVFTDSQFLGALENSVLMTAGCVIISMLLGIALAVLLDRRFLGRGVVRTLLISPFLVMPAAGALLWKTTMLDPVYGILNYVLSPFGVHHVDFISRFPMASVITVLVWQWTPFMVLIVLAGLQSQPKDVLEAASVDGAGAFTTFRAITLAHLRSYIELGVLLGSVYVVNTFDTVYMMTQGGPGTSTTNLPYYLYQRAFQGYDVGQAASLGVVTVIGTMIVASVALRLVFKTFMGTKEDV